jgi:hypothetical protein
MVPSGRGACRGGVTLLEEVARAIEFPDPDSISRDVAARIEGRRRWAKALLDDTAPDGAIRNRKKTAEVAKTA